jgi:rhodanese-related sulfurtransferase
VAAKLESVTAFAASKLVEQGALLVDIRESGELARARVPGAAHVPLSGLDNSDIPAQPGQAVIFFCATGGRTASYAGQLAAKAGGRKAYVMQGGISGWMMTGLPTEQGNDSGGPRQRGFLSRLFA